VRLSGLILTDLGRGFVFSKVRVMSSVFGTALFVCYISLGSSESWYSYGLVCFCCWLMMIFVHSLSEFCVFGSVSKEKLGFSGCVLMCVFSQT
jgi:hypothetical protein